MIKITTPFLDNVASDYLEKIKSFSFKDNDYDNIFTSNIDDLILCPPGQFIATDSEYSTRLASFDECRLAKFTAYMTGLYKRIICDEKVGYWLTTRLGVNVCPYCNRQYTFTIDKQNKIRPQIDHFLPKSKYPLFALSFYNLIPTCPECNRLKRDEIIEINPYISGFDKCKFYIDGSVVNVLEQSEVANWSIKFSNTDDCISNISTFALEELYNGHKDYVSEVIFKTVSNNRDYYNLLSETFLKTGLSASEINRILYGAYLLPIDQGKRPLSKLTADILEQFNMSK